MSVIGVSMQKRGYLPLADDGLGGIGMRPSLKNPDRKLEEEVWFDTGQRMKDGKGNPIPMTVSAKSESEYGAYLRKGWTPVLPQGLRLEIEEKVNAGVRGPAKAAKARRR